MFLERIKNQQFFNWQKSIIQWINQPIKSDFTQNWIKNHHFLWLERSAQGHSYPLWTWPLPFYNQPDTGSTRSNKTSSFVWPSAFRWDRAESLWFRRWVERSCTLFNGSDWRRGRHLTCPRRRPKCPLFDDTKSRTMAEGEGLTLWSAARLLTIKSKSRAFCLLEASWCRWLLITTSCLLTCGPRVCLWEHTFGRSLLQFWQKVLQLIWSCHLHRQYFLDLEHFPCKRSEPFPFILTLLRSVISGPWLNCGQTFLLFISFFQFVFK